MTKKPSESIKIISLLYKILILIMKMEWVRGKLKVKMKFNC